MMIAHEWKNQLHDCEKKTSDVTLKKYTDEHCSMNKEEHCQGS